MLTFIVLPHWNTMPQTLDIILTLGRPVIALSRKSWVPSDEQLILFLTTLVCRGPGSNPWPPVPRSGHFTTWATGAGKKQCKLMVLVHICFICNTAIFFALTKTAKTYRQKLEHWQNYNNSNGKLALIHIVPFPTENDDCRIPTPLAPPFPDNDYDFQPDFPTENIYRKNILSHFTFHLVWPTQRISKIFSAYTKTYSFYRAISFGKWKVHSGMGK